MPRNKVLVPVSVSGFALHYFCSKVEMIAKKEKETGEHKRPDSASFVFVFLNQAIQYYQEFLTLKREGGLVKKVSPSLL